MTNNLAIYEHILLKGFRGDHTIMHNVANSQKSHNSYKLCQLTMVTQHAQLHAKDYKIGICCFSAKYAALRRKSKDWLGRNQNNVSKWSDMSICGLLFQWAIAIKIQLDMLV